MVTYDDAAARKLLRRLDRRSWHVHCKVICMQQTERSTHMKCETYCELIAEIAEWGRHYQRWLGRAENDEQREYWQQRVEALSTALELLKGKS